MPVSGKEASAFYVTKIDLTTPPKCLPRQAHVNRIAPGCCRSRVTPVPTTSEPRYNGSMPKRVSNCLIAFFLLIGTVLCSVPPVGAWVCEGKQCGITLWACCCAAPTTEDGQCGTTADVGKNSAKNAVQGKNATLCAAGCRCTMVITSAPDCDHALPPAALGFDAFPVLAILPAPVIAYFPPVVTETGGHPIEARGPPSRRIARHFHSLRAPPVA